MKKAMKKHKLAEFVPEPNMNEIKEKKKRNKVLGQNRGVKEMGRRSKAIVDDQYDIEASKSGGEDREKSKSKVLRKEKRKRDKMNNDTGIVDVLHDSGEDTLDRQNGEGEDREKSKSKVLKKEQRKRNKMNNDTGKVEVLHDSAEDTLDGQNGEHKQGKKRDVKSRKKGRRTEKKKNAGNDKVNVLDNEVQDGPKEENGKSGKARGSKRKDHLSSKKEEKLVGKGEALQNEVYEISSGDEDCSKGMKKWITEYHQSRPGLEILQQRIDDFMTAYEVQQEQARNEQEALAAEGGWTVVVHHKGRKKTTDTESGIAVGSVAQAAVMEREAKKKSKTKDVGVDFYRFQKREAQRNEIMALQSKFEQDKKRIQQLRAARKFRPY